MIEFSSATANTTSKILYRLELIQVSFNVIAPTGSTIKTFPEEKGVYSNNQSAFINGMLDTINLSSSRYIHDDTVEITSIMPRSFAAFTGSSSSPKEGDGNH